MLGGGSTQSRLGYKPQTDQNLTTHLLVRVALGEKFKRSSREREEERERERKEEEM
jgi:hypothetical protein